MNDHKTTQPIANKEHDLYWLVVRLLPPSTLGPTRLVDVVEMTGRRQLLRVLCNSKCVLFILTNPFPFSLLFLTF
jgi:hypothetical protein